MDEVHLRLTDAEHSRVRGMSCEQAALEICRIHLTRSDPNVAFLAPAKGADLRFRRQDGVETDIEVKGTEAGGLAWAKLKVSSQHSHDRLRDGMQLFRVTGIRAQEVKIFVMKHGVDFKMVVEPRWSVRPARVK